jgi:hypothetical protein
MSDRPTLEKAVGRALVRGTAKIWHFGERYRWSPPFGKWLATGEQVTIKPGETIPPDVAVIDA